VAQADPISESSDGRGGGQRLTASGLMWAMDPKEERGRGRRLAVLVAIACGVFLWLLAPNRAHANYTVQECVSGFLGNADAFPVRPFADAAKIKQSDSCASPYGLRLEANGRSNYSTWVGWQWNAPSNTTFDSARTRVHYWTDGGYGPMMSGNGTPGYAAVGTGGEQWVTAVEANTSFYSILEQCFAHPCDSTAAFAYVDNFFADVHDLVAPSVSASGELLDGGTVSGVQTINAAVSDSGGGARSIEVYVNGVLSASDEFCAPKYLGSYTALKPCSDSSGARAIQLDTEHGPGWVNGSNDVQICGFDAARNRSPCVRQAVHADNSCAGSGGAAATVLDSGADIGGELRRRAEVTSKQAPVIRGSLRDGAGNPVGGATVCIYQTTDLPDASRELATTVTTQANGRFATRLDPGPSRSVDLVYRYNTRKLTDRVDLQSRVVPALGLPKKQVANGHSAVFRGDIPGPNAEGRAIALQARVGRKWRTFKQLRTEADGRFKGKYRFTQSFGRVRYVFRALVKSQGGYPYEPGASKKRRLVVKG
jgi:5-hydroxyisourate hydrolase-like protein (transthyretin family)